jgi:serralysin
MTQVVNASGNQDIDGILWGWEWGSGGAQNLTYSFPTGTAEYSGYAAVNGFSSFNTTQQTAVRSILTNVASFSNLTFTETTGSGAILRYAEASSINYTNNSAVATYTGLHTINTAEATPPELAYNGTAPFSPSYAQGDSWYNPSGYNNPVRGSFQYAAGIMHETGHNLGLKHGHVTQSGHGVTFPTLPSNHDSYEYSVMTYRQFPGDNASNSDNALDHPTTYMQDDIAALQYMYGANYGATAQNGNTTYTWSPTTGEQSINGVRQQNAPYRNYVLMTVWDGGGNDTYDFSNYTTNLSVDLNPGAWTTLDTSASHLQRADLGNNGSGGAEYFAHGNIANALIDPNHPTETASLIENAYGGSGSDRIVGNAANNVLYGNAGNDTISGGSGDDYMDGGAGIDTIDYTYWNGGGTYNLATGQAVFPGFYTEDILNFENIWTGTGNDTVVGSVATNVIATSGGNDNINGGDGNDTIYAGDGNDTVDGGNGNDLIYLGNGDDYLNITSDGNDTFYGEAGNDYIYGYTGNETHYGGDGNDTLLGSAGNDTINGGSGDDYMDGGTGIDTVDYTYWNGGGTYNLATGQAVFPSFYTEDILNFENIWTGTGNDTVVGSAAANVIATSGGNDNINGGDGNDLIYLGNGDDYLNILSSGDDTFYGEAGNDYIYGYTGNETYYGGDGNDTLLGSAGNDTINGGSGNDYMDGGTGIDTVDYTYWNGGGTYNLATGVASFPGFYNETILNFENILTGTGNDTVVGSAVANKIVTSGGNDSINGGDGNDTIYAGDGNDTLLGAAGNPDFSPVFFNEKGK